MSKSTDAPKRAVKDIIGFRPAELTPLLNAWLERNPYMDITVLLKQSIRSNPEIRKLAGKRFAHLVAAYITDPAHATRVIMEEAVGHVGRASARPSADAQRHVARCSAID